MSDKEKDIELYSTAFKHIVKLCRKELQNIEDKATAIWVRIIRTVLFVLLIKFIFDLYALNIINYFIFIIIKKYFSYISFKNYII